MIMKIGIDISQTAYEGTGVGNYMTSLVSHLLSVDDQNEYILFFSSLRRDVQRAKFNLKEAKAKCEIKTFRLPPTVLDLLWNRLHILPIENLIGDVDVFISSDWTQPPTKKAKKITILYDLIVYKYPEETHNQMRFNLMKLLISPNIVASQKRRLHWVKKECDKIICISESTKKDATELLGIDESRLKVVYPTI